MPQPPDAEKITRDDIEAQFRVLKDTIEGRTVEAKAKAMPALAIGGLLLIVLVYLIGKRSGRRRSTIVEIRRI